MLTGSGRGVNPFPTIAFLLSLTPMTESSSNIVLRNILPTDFPAVARLIRDSTNQWYKQNRGFEVFTCPVSDVQLFPSVYHDLDPGCCILAEDVANSRIAGSCFYHPRPTHVSLGIMNVHPEYFGQSIATRLLTHIIDLAHSQNLPTRLVSSAMNLDSYSLYNRHGFKPLALFQDMTLTIPSEGPAIPTDNPAFKNLPAVRPATLADAPAMAKLERQLFGIQRQNDFEYFIQNRDQIWHTLITENPEGQITGYLTSIIHPASNMLGPGAMFTDTDAIALITAQLLHNAGRSPVFLIPADHPNLTAAMYQLGAKNCEIHVTQSTMPPDMAPHAAPVTSPSGGSVIMPTFMPETA